MNIETLAVYSEADRNAMHVQLADQAHQVGSGSEPQRSYLKQEELLHLAHSNGANAIHPGYGFLSENSEFSTRCQEEKLVFVGPSPESIRSMGIKSESKRIMIAANVPVVPGYHGDEQTNERLLDEAQKIGFPVLIKPVRGGGGKGMRVVYNKENFLDELDSSRRESLKAFNDQSMLIEKYIEKPRHIEVQIFGDSQRNYVYLFERDCSVQRRHQKIIEEAPAPLLDSSKRRELGEMAVAAARAVDYVGAGTVEFIMDRENGQFYFMEMNTRLQVEHPITEMITGTDLVEWQLRVAAGERLPKQQAQIYLNGHAFEARIYAENPEDNFLPQTGSLDYICLPECLQGNGNNRSDGIRLDTGVRQGDHISPFYDPMIAKLIVWGRNRDEALERMRRALGDYVILGLPTNVSFLKRLASNKSFQLADVGTDFIDLHQSELFPDSQSRVCGKISSNLIAEIGAVVFILVENGASAHAFGISSSPKLRAFRTIGQHGPIYEFTNLKLANLPNALHVKFHASGANEGELSISSANQQAFKGLIKKVVNANEIIVGLQDGRQLFKFRQKSPILSKENETKLLLRNESIGETHEITLNSENLLNESMARTQAPAGGNPLQARAPMPGIIEKVLVAVGDRVESGQSLIILSAMKMEYTIKAAADGLIDEISCKQGDFVAKEALLVRLKGATPNPSINIKN